MTSFCAQFSHNHVDLLRHAAPCAVIIDLKIDLEPVYVPLGLVIQRLLVEFITCLARSFEAYAVVGFHADNNEPLRAATGVFVRLPNVGDDRTKHSITTVAFGKALKTFPHPYVRGNRGAVLSVPLVNGARDFATVGPENFV